MPLILLFLAQFGIAAEPNFQIPHKQLEAAILRFPNITYSNEAYNYATGLPEIDHWGTVHDFPAGKKLSDLTDKSGNLLLFRYIRGTYQPGFTSGFFIKQEFNTYSYSLSPSLVTKWRSSDQDEEVLIAMQNIEKDSLYYKVVRRIDPGEDTSSLPRSATRKESPSIAWLTHYPTVEKDMPLERVLIDEIKVPIPQENVVGVVRAKALREIVAGYGKNTFTLHELMEKIYASPHFRSLRTMPLGSNKNCQALFTETSR